MNTKETQHTPGPWTRRGTHIYYQRNAGGYRFDIAEVFRDVGAQKAEANAHLIAAAPELLAACQEMLRQFEPADPEADVSDCDAIVLARAAIAKARGQ